MVGQSDMTTPEAEAYILALLRDRGALSTMEIEQIAALDSRRCPDRTVVFLAKMRGKGLIEGEVSIEKRGWVWRVSAQTPPG